VVVLKVTPGEVYLQVPRERGAVGELPRVEHVDLTTRNNTLVETRRLAIILVRRAQLIYDTSALELTSVTNYSPSLPRRRVGGTRFSRCAAAAPCRSRGQLSAARRSAAKAAAAAAPGVISDCHFSVQPNHFIPGSLSYSVAVFRK
jgi:hypothetical protein